MGVRADHSRHLSIQEASHRDFFRSRFPMHVHEDVRGLLPHGLHRLLHGQKGILQRRHESAALHVDHPELMVAHLTNRRPLPGCSRGVVDGPHKSGFVRQQLDHLLLVPEMIARGDDIHPALKDRFCRLGGDAGAARGVFSVGHHNLDSPFLPQAWNHFPHHATPRRTDNIPDKQQLHVREVQRTTPACPISCC